MPKRNFHVPLPEELYALLQQEAARHEVPATQLAREAIERHLTGLSQDLLHQQIADYARAMAGTSHDLDPLLESAGTDHLWDTLKDDSW